MRRELLAIALVLLATAPDAAVGAQEARARGAAPAAGAALATVAPPAGYVIGPEDVLSIVFWRDEEMSGQVTVRPDGKISLPLLDEVQAAGLTPAELRTRLIDESRRFFGNPSVTVVVDEIHSRKVFITGQVAKPGSYVIIGPTSVLQLIAMAGGLKDYADAKHITILRQEHGRSATYRFNYDSVRKNPAQNIELKPGDTVVVP